MADIYLHSKMAEETVAIFDRVFDKNTLFLGAQSSDPMYYAVFHKNGKQYRYYADRMHDTDTQKLLVHMTNYVKQNTTRHTYSYLIGFLCHYALDVHIHPYVYHHVGIYNEKDPSTYQYQGLHLKFERSIDCVLMKQDTKKSSRHMSLTKYHFPTKTAHNDVVDLMKSTINNQFDIENGGEVFTTSVKHMYNIIKYMTTDRFGIKKQVYKLVDFFRKNHNLFMVDMSLFHHVEDYDFLNEEHREWQHPVTGNISTKSVHDIYNDAIRFARELIEQVHRYIDGEPVDLNTVFTNLSFNSGVKCEDSYPFQYIHAYRP
jgi:hypothetical protein